MKREAFEAQHGRLSGDVLYIDLDEQPQPVEEVLTAGWTDSQLKAKPIEELDDMIASGELGLKNLDDIVAVERERVDGLIAARSRKLIL